MWNETKTHPEDSMRRVCQGNGTALFEVEPKKRLSTDPSFVFSVLSFSFLGGPLCW